MLECWSGIVVSNLNVYFNDPRLQLAISFKRKTIKVLILKLLYYQQKWYNKIFFKNHNWLPHYFE